MRKAKANTEGKRSSSLGNRERKGARDQRSHERGDEGPRSTAMGKGKDWLETLKLGQHLSARAEGNLLKEKRIDSTEGEYTNTSVKNIMGTQ